MANITKNDLTVSISVHTGISRIDTKKVIDSLIAAIGDAMASGNTIELRGFGTFSTRMQKKRPVRNPRTGQKLLLKEQTVPSLKFSDEIKAKVAGLR